MDSSLNGAAGDSSKCNGMSVDEKRQLVYELSKQSHLASEVLQAWSRQEILQILCAEMGKERKYTGLTKVKIIEALLKIVSEKNSGENETKKRDSDCFPVQRNSKRQRKVDNPTRYVNPTSNNASGGCNSVNTKGEENTTYCNNLACKAILRQGDLFCRRCSCCICRKYDDNKDPSLWLTCSSDPPFVSDSCGFSCHLECAFKIEKSGLANDNQRELCYFYCVSCGKPNSLLECWKKQLTIAKETRRVDVLCYRLFLVQKLLKGSAKYTKLREAVDEAVKCLEADVGPLTGLPMKMGRGIVYRLESGPDVQKLCSSALESLETLQATPHDVVALPSPRGSKMQHDCSLSNEVSAAILRQGDLFCRRCSCCICRKYDDNKDPSLWLTCSSDPPFVSDSCGFSCHLECAFKIEKSGLANDNQRELCYFYCVSCGKPNSLLECWKKQLTIAKETRRVDVLCYRLFLVQKLLKGSAKYTKLREAVDEAVKCLEADVGPLTGLPMKMGRGIVNRLESGPDVQKLCSSALESLETLQATPHDVVALPSPRGSKMQHDFSLSNEVSAAILRQGDLFCRRCSCCICRKYDDNKDPSLWLTCSSDPPFVSDSCGFSCHLECAFKIEKSGLANDNQRELCYFYCVSCGKPNTFLECWKKQLTIAKETRRVDVLCYRLFLVQKLLKGSAKYTKLREAVDEAVKCLEADVGPLTGLPMKMGRGIVNRLESGPDVQKLCSSALESLETLQATPHDVVALPSPRGSKMQHDCSLSNEVSAAILRQGDLFCRRCSCCICRKYDDNKDPSLWLTCSSDPPFVSDSCGFSCHLECAFKIEKSGLANDNQRELCYFYCVSCGKPNSLLECWKKQLTIAKETRRVDVLCYRLFLVQKLLKGSAKYTKLREAVDEAVKCLEADVGPLTGLPMKMGRGIVNRLESGPDVQKLCSSALESLETLQATPHDVVALPSPRGSKMQHDCSLSNEVSADSATTVSTKIRFEDVNATSLTVILASNELTSPANIIHYSIWHRKASEKDYSEESTCTLFTPSTRFVVSGLAPASEYCFKVVSFSGTRELGVDEINVLTRSSPEEGTNCSSLVERSESPLTNCSTLSSTPSSVEAESNNAYIAPQNQLQNDIKDYSLAQEHAAKRAKRTTTESDTEQIVLLEEEAVLEKNRETQAPVTKTTNLASNRNSSEASLPITPFRSDQTKNRQARSIKPVKNSGNNNGDHSANGGSESGLEHCVKIIRQLECSEHIEKDFRQKFLTWFSLRATPQETRVVKIFIDAFTDDPIGLAEQLIHTFNDRVSIKRSAIGGGGASAVVPSAGFCMKLWH